MSDTETINQHWLDRNIVRYGDLIPCRSAFIDAHTPGSHLKENFTIIGGGVSESPDQHVHIRETPGFNIGAAGQPPGCTNSLHTHTTAEVFFVHKGRWRFFWGEHGTDGEFIAEEGDLFNIPTGIFRGFENVGTDYGMLMAILGGDDAGGGVVWAPHVIEAAQDHGLVLAENGRLYDRNKGEALPEGVKPTPTLTPEELKQFPIVQEDQVISYFVARYLDMKALGRQASLQVLGADGVLRDRPGFEIDFLQRGQSGLSDPYVADQYEVLMVHRGHWRVTVDDVEATLAPGDTCLLPPGRNQAVEPTMSGETALFRVRSTTDPAGLTRTREL
ncbi:MAG: cupin domain-containing protein, partial [Natronospirillum sp.]